MPDPPEDEQHFDDDSVTKKVEEHRHREFSEDRPVIGEQESPSTPPERESGQESGSE